MAATSSGLTGALVCPVCGTRYPADSKFCTHDGSPLVAAAADGDPLIGSVIADRYRIIKLLGEGGMGRVYEASHLNIAKRYALKLLRPNVLDNPEAIARFRQEAWAASSIGHPNIISIDDFATLPDGGVYLAMEYLDGESLAARMQQRLMTLGEILHVTVQMVSALAAAHQKNIVHRDIKPENVFLAKTNQGEMVKLLDFGIAKVTDTSGAHLTKTGAVFGTPYYMSPEQALGRPLDHRTDIYSSGVILYELAVGHVPFAAESFLEVLHHHISTEPQTPHEAAPGRVDPGLEAIIVRAMAKDRDKRYATMDELLDDLRALGQSALGIDPEALGQTYRPAAGPMRSGAAPATGDRTSQPNLPSAAPVSGPAPVSRSALGRVSTPPRNKGDSQPVPSLPPGSVGTPVAPVAPAASSVAVSTQRGPATPRREETPARGGGSSMLVLVVVGLAATAAGIGGVAWWRGRTAAIVEPPPAIAPVVAAATPAPAAIGAKPETTPKPEHKAARPEPKATTKPARPEATPKATTKPEATPKATTRPGVAATAHPEPPPPPMDPYSPPPPSHPSPHAPTAPATQPLGSSLVDREVAQRMPGSRRVGGVYKAVFVQEDGRNDYTINFDAGHCYTFFTAGGPGVKEISLYLWDPNGRRAATHRSDAAQATFQHCTTMTGPYHVQVKVGDGAGETQFGVYTR